MTDAPMSPGEVLHRARCAGGEQRPRPWPPEDWADRDPRLKAVDEAMAAAVEAVVRRRIAAELRAFAHADRPPSVPGIERRAQRDTYLAAAQVALHGLAEERSDEKAGKP